MLSLDLFDSKYERELREGAVDDLEYRRMNDLREKMEYLMQAYKKADTDEVKNAIMKRYNEYKTEREGYMKVREQQVPSRQDPFAYVKPEPKGIGDIQDPKQKMAQLAQRSKKGAMANVAAGIKAFVKGEPEPMGEEQQLGRRGVGMTNIKNLGLTASKGLAGTIFQFPNMRYLVNEDDSDKMVDYYNALDSAGRTNFVYNVLGDGMKFLEMCRSLGIKPTPVEQQQPELPGMQVDPQGQLPLSEKKKSSNDDLEAGDVKVARELQKLRAQYPAAKSDVEAVARAEIDSTERSQQQLAAIRGANEKQDALLKQLVALDQEQGREISGLDKENDSLEQRLAQVQATNDRLQQAVGTMVGAKKAAAKTQKPAPQGSADLAQGGIIDVGGPVAGKDTNTSVDQAKTDQTVPGNLPKATGLDPITKPDEFQPIQKRKVSGSDIKEHGGGIGPRQHWQDLMQEGQPQELINRYLAINAETDVDAVRKAIQAISRDSTLSATSKSRLLGQIGMIIQRHRLPIGRSYYTFMQQYMEAVELDRARVPGYPNDPATVKHRLDTAKAILSDPRSDADSRREAAAIVAKSDRPGVNETVENVRAGMAKIYRRLAPKIERHRDSFLAGQLYDELENYAELHGAEGEFKRMMATARNSAHMEYDTNPGGFQNWFWFLPFEDEQLEEAKIVYTVVFVDPSVGPKVVGKFNNAAEAKKLIRDSFNDMYDTGDHLRNVAPGIYVLEEDYRNTGERATAKNYKHFYHWIIQTSQGVAEGLIYSGDTWQDVLYRINVLNDIFGDQKDLAASFEPASQPEWGPFRDRILRSSTVLDTYAKVKQLANMNVPLTDVEIEMLADVAWDGGGGPVEPAGHWGEGDYDWLEDLYAQQFAVVQHLLDQRAQGYGQNKTKSGQTVHEQGMTESTDDVKKRMSKLEALALAANRAGDDAKCKRYQQKIQSLKQKLSQSMAEGWSDQGNPTPYSVYIDGREWRAYKSDDHARAVAEKVRANLKQQGRDQTVTIAPSKAKKVNEGREIQTREDFIKERDRLLRMIGIETDPANKQILKSAIRQLENRAENEGWITIQSRMVREDSDGGEAVEMAIMRRMLVAHTDLIVEFGLDKVVQAIEEVAYNVGDTDEIGSSDVSGWVRQVKQILGVDA